MSRDLFGQLDPATDPVRLEWRAMVERTLPALARERMWPIQLDHCFARVLLDNAVGKPWREAIAAPAWKNAPPETLKAATSLGQAAIDGTEDLAVLNARSLMMRRAATG